MANEPRRRQSAPPATPQNTAAMAVILVAVGVGIALLLFITGGGKADNSASGKTAAELAGGSTTTTTPPSTIPVNLTPPVSLEIIVGNGSGKTGRGKKVADKLIAAGYSNAKAINGKSASSTTIYYIAGAQDDAVAVSNSMNLGAGRVAPLPTTLNPLDGPIGTARVVVLVGSDFNPDSVVFNPAATTASG